MEYLGQPFYQTMTVPFAKTSSTARMHRPRTSARAHAHAPAHIGIAKFLFPVTSSVKKSLALERTPSLKEIGGISSTYHGYTSAKVLDSITGTSALTLKAVS